MKLSDASMGGQEDISTTNSNNLVQSDKPQVNRMALFLANMPTWFVHYQKQIMYFSLKLRSFTYGAPIQVADLQE